METQRILSYKAKPVGDQPVPDLVISFAVEMDGERAAPDHSGWPEDHVAHQAFYATEARRLVAHMKRTLPGGLFVAMAGAFLESNAPIFIVPMPENA